VLIFEGWCVGALPQPEVDLAQAVNDLEANEDPDGIWRDFANTELAGEYQRLFGRLDALIMLAAPSFAVVAGWRLQQEQDLASTGLPLMDRAAVERFVSHYERLTNWILAEMPARADLVARLDQKRRVVSLG
jgi:D-glycerate 3-kinase